MWLVPLLALTAALNPIWSGPRPSVSTTQNTVSPAVHLALGAILLIPAPPSCCPPDAAVIALSVIGGALIIKGTVGLVGCESCAQAPGRSCSSSALTLRSFGSTSRNHRTHLTVMSPRRSSSSCGGDRAAATRCHRRPGPAMGGVTMPQAFRPPRARRRLESCETRSTIRCRCGRCLGCDAEVVEQGLHFAAEGFVVAVDGGPVLGWAAVSWGSDTSDQGAR